MNEIEEVGNSVNINPHGVSAGRGASWFAEAFTLFKEAPFLWIGILIVLLIINIVLGLIPVLGQLAANLLWPVFVAGIVAGCAAQDDGDELTFSHLFAGFGEKVGALIGLGAMYLMLIIAVILVMIVVASMMGLGVGALMQGADPSTMISETMIVILVLIMSVLMLPAMMAIWFAPALVMLGDKGIIESLRLSIIGCLKNILPMSVYGVIGFLLMIVAMIPLGLGLFVVMPIFCITIYTAYKDIYIE